MRIVITGGAGFLGRRLASAILEIGRLAGPTGEVAEVGEIVLFDAVVASDLEDQRLQAMKGDLCDPRSVADAIAGETASVIHLASVVSGEAEADFDKGMAVNLDGTRNVLEACRHLPGTPRVVFPSSVAAFGGELPDMVTDTTAPTPRSSYGTQKVASELLVSDYTRKGFVDGRCVRIPTVSVRPGKPNKAASGFASGILREPLDGVDAVCPVPAQTLMWLSSPRATVANLIHAHDLPAERWGDNRSLNLPGLSVTVGEMVEALRRVAGDKVAARVVWQRDAAVEAIINTWPGAFDTARANALGFVTDSGFEQVIRDYIEGESG